MMKNYIKIKVIGGIGNQLFVLVFGLAVSARLKSKLIVDVSFIKKNNYPKNKLMWEAISNRGMPIPYFSPSKSVAVNTEIYINECLQPRLLPFIHKHHSDFNF